jgi:hypothetical protein
MHGNIVSLVDSTGVPLNKSGILGVVGSGGGGGGSEAIAGGGYATNGANGVPNADYYTYNVATDTYTTITQYSSNLYSQGGYGNSNDGTVFGGHVGSGSNTRTEHWNSISWGAGGPIIWTGGGQCQGGGTSGTDGLCLGSGQASYGLNTTYAYDGSWVSGQSLTYYQRQSAQGGDKNGSGISITGYGGNTGTGTGASQRAEACTRGSYNGAWSSITNTTHKGHQGTWCSAGDSSDFNYVGGYDTATTTYLTLNTKWNGVSYSAETPITTAQTYPNGCGGDDTDNIISFAGLNPSGAISDTSYYWNGISWITIAVYPQDTYAGNGGFIQ